MIKTHQEVLKSTDKFQKVRTINIMGFESTNWFASLTWKFWVLAVWFEVGV